MMLVFVLEPFNAFPLHLVKKTLDVKMQNQQPARKLACHRIHSFHFIDVQQDQHKYTRGF